MIITTMNDEFVCYLCDKVIPHHRIANLITVDTPIERRGEELALCWDCAEQARADGWLKRRPAELAGLED